MTLPFITRIPFYKRDDTPVILNKNACFNASDFNSKVYFDYPSGGRGFVEVSNEFKDFYPGLVKEIIKKQQRIVLI